MRGLMHSHPPIHPLTHLHESTVDQLALVPEAERSDSVRSMEMITMQAAIKHGIGSDRHLKVSSRLGELDKNAPATFESKAGEAFAHFMNGVLTTGAKAEEEKPDRTKLQTPSVQQAKEGFDSAVVHGTRSWLDANLLTQDPIKNRMGTLYTFHFYGMFSFLAQNKTASVELEESFGGEAALTQAIEEYDFHVDEKLHKEIGYKEAVLRNGTILAPLLFRFGALRSYETWLEKTLHALQEIGPFTDYVSESVEVHHLVLHSGAPICVWCGFEDDAWRILAATGLAEWTDTGMDAYWATASAAFPFSKTHMRVFIHTPTRPHTHTRAQSRT